MTTPLINQLGIVKQNTVRTDPAIVAHLEKFGSVTVHEAMGRVGLMKPYMRPIYPGALVSGTAVTVLLQPGDNWTKHVAAEQIRPDDVVVAGITAECADGYFGDLLATSFMARGAKALVIDGGVRDVRVLKDMGFPVWSKAISAKGTIIRTRLGQYSGCVRRSARQSRRRRDCRRRRHRGCPCGRCGPRGSGCTETGRP
jgi:4-hydroxy-4-methyl-2-oxoglutarate aldolase